MRKDKEYKQLKMKIYRDNSIELPKEDAKKQNKTKKANIKLDDITQDIIIISEKQYNKETGKTLNKCNSDNKDRKKSAKVVDIDIDDNIEINKKHKIDNYESITNIEQTQNTIDKQKITIDSTKEIKSDFIKSVIDANERKDQLLKEELSNIDLEYPYIAVDLMTRAEKQLLYFMENNLMLIERVRILPKVRLGDIINLDERVCKDMKAYYKIASKHVDFVIVDKVTFKVICVVELDDYTHETEEAKLRDETKFRALYAASIKMHKIKCKIAEIAKCDILNIENDILYEYRPKCAYCGADTDVKSSKRHSNYGHRFYGCTKFVDCRWTQDID